MNSGIYYNKASDIGWKLSQGIEYSLKHKKFDENYFSTPSVTRSDFFCFTLISIVQKCSLMDIGQVSTSALRVWYNFFLFIQWLEVAELTMKCIRNLVCHVPLKNQQKINGSVYCFAIYLLLLWLDVQIRHLSDIWLSLDTVSLRR